MPLGLITGRAFSPFSRAFSSRSTATNCFSSATSLRSAANSASSSKRDRLDGSAGAAMTAATSCSATSLQAKNASYPRVLPRLQTEPLSPCFTIIFSNLEGLGHDRPRLDHGSRNFALLRRWALNVRSLETRGIDGPNQGRAPAGRMEQCLLGSTADAACNGRNAVAPDVLSL